ncbi:MULTISPECIES: hypothetical protein [Paenibacillus]|uniref:hypothetical protein n=1 Tax=Paenibacillus TaxID=44249 RepID=UPI002FE09672
MSRRTETLESVKLEPVPGALRVIFPGEAPRGNGARRSKRAAEGASGVEAAADTAPPPLCVVELPAPAPGGADGDRLLRQLEGRPLILAGLLEEGAAALSALLPELPPWRREPGPAAAPVCACGAAPGGGHVPQALAAADAAWAADPGLRLALLGWTPEALAAAVLERWAAAQPLPAPEEALRQTAGGPEAQRSAAGDGPNVAEWLAELAAEGRLHLPGPQFHDVEAELRELAPPDVEPGHGPGPDAASWARLLLPGVPGAARGLSLVAGRVMERAADLAAAHSPKKTR